MGHLHLEAIRELARKGMVKGLTISSTNYDHVCEGCTMGKSHRLPLPKRSETTSGPMDLVVADLTGPMKIETWTGMRYALVLVEVSSRYGVMRLLRTKDEAPDMLKEIIALLERQSERKLKCLCTDNGTKLVNDRVDEICRRNGIRHETSMPYGPEQNGIVERFIATCFEMVRCMLHVSSMDLRYWGEVLMYAIHIRNLSPTTAIPDVVPYKAWTGRKPSVSHLRIFGSIP